MSKSWREPPPEGRSFKKPQYERTLEEEMREMNEDRYLVIATWGQGEHDFEENVALHRTEHGAWVTLHAIAEGQGLELKAGENSFEIEGDKHADYYGWYINAMVEGA